MKIIDGIRWKEFRIGDLFNIYPTKAYKLTNSSLFEEDGVNPVVVNSSFNNGIGGYTNQPVTEKGNIITFSDTTTATAMFYQEKPFVGYAHIQGMHPIGKHKDKWNEKSLLFFLSVFKNRAVNSNFDYVNKFTRKSAKEMMIKLPTDKDGNPDFPYMEEYIEKLEGKVTASLIALDRAKHIPKKKADSSDWKDFGVVDFFDLSLPKGDIQVKGLDDGDIALITPSNTNNGLIQRIPRNSESTLYDAGCLTVDMFGNAYYHEEDFFVTAHGHVNVLIPKISISKGVGLFIATAIKSMFIQKYGFKDMCTQKVLKREMIKLPITSDGVPDWNYMEQYMDRLQKKAEQLINCFG